MPRRKRMGSPSLLLTPFTRTSPAVGVNRRFTSLSVVLFPEPLRPSNTRASPRWTAKFRPQSTCVSPTRYDTSRNSMSGASVSVGGIVASIPEFTGHPRHKTKPTLLWRPISGHNSSDGGGSLNTLGRNHPRRNPGARHSESCAKQHDDSKREYERLINSVPNSFSCLRVQIRRPLEAAKLGGVGL